MQPSDEIKSKIDIVDLIREYIPLKAAGVNFRALCPFHHERTPSFIVSPEKQIWHCFGCGKGGDIFSFTMEMEGLSFSEALRNLASKAGVTLRREDAQLSSKRNRLLDIVDFSSRYYHKMLLESQEAELIRTYLAGRGAKEETIEKWRIGYSPDSWDDLINLLKNKGYTENEIFLAGLSVKKEGASRFYNRFRARIMFPINDINGNVVAFSARVNPGKEAAEKMGKYINSPRTLIYDKSKILFGLDRAKQEIKKKDLAVIAEGQMDAITAHQEGYGYVVASSGTALTTEQVALLKRFTVNIALAFDMDKAGELAAERGVREALKAEMSAKVIKLPTGKDPDECIKSDKPGWEEALKNAQPILEYYFDKTFSNLDVEKEEGRRKAVKNLLPIIAQLGSKLEQNFWIKKLSQAIDTKEEILFESLSKISAPPAVSTKSDEDLEEVKIILSREQMLSELLIALILKFPQFMEYAVSHLESTQIVGEAAKRLYNNLIIYYNNIIANWTQEGGELEQPQLSYEGFKKWLEDLEGLGESNEYKNDGREKEDRGEESQLHLLEKLVILGDKDFYDYEPTGVKNEIIKIITNLKKYYLSERRKEIKKLIYEAENSRDEDSLSGLLQEFKTLSDEIRELEVDVR